MPSESETIENLNHEIISMKKQIKNLELQYEKLNNKINEVSGIMGYIIVGVIGISLLSWYE